MERREFPFVLRIAIFGTGLVTIGAASWRLIEAQRDGDDSQSANSPGAERTIEPTFSPADTLLVRVTPTSTPADVVIGTPIRVVATPTPVATQPPVLTTQIPKQNPAATATVPPTIAPTPEPTVVFDERFRYDWADRLYELINQFRGENGLPSLARNQLLDEAGRGYAKFFLEHGDFSQPSHDLDGSPTERAIRAGYSAIWVGEVLAGDRNSPESLMESWKNSTTGHREALLTTDRTVVDLGVGCYQGPYTYRVSHETILVVICTGEMGIPKKD